MKLTGAELLIGPRGRRLCLELAKLMDDDVRQTAYYAVVPFYEQSSLSRTHFAILDGVHGQQTIRTGPLPAISISEFTKILRSAKMHAPSQAELLHALDYAVVSARYWQGPDQDDLLAATPEIVATLRPIADLIAASKFAKWWVDPVFRNGQWELLRGQPGVADTRKILGDWEQKTIAEEARCRTEYPPDVTANFSGTWWSTPSDAWGLPVTTRSIDPFGPVGLSLEEDGRGEPASRQKYQISPAARVYEIRQPTDWMALCERYPLEVTASRRHDWYRVTGHDPHRWVIPNWASVHGEYDGVHLTVAAHLATAGRALPVSDGGETVMAGFSPDSTYWLSGLAKIATPIGDPVDWPMPQWEN